MENILPNKSTIAKYPLKMTKFIFKQVLTLTELRCFLLSSISYTPFSSFFLDYVGILDLMEDLIELYLLAAFWAGNKDAT
jgi:hypothetical protein